MTQVCAKLRPYAERLISELEKDYPGITNTLYTDGWGQTNFCDRIVMALYIELIKSGFINSSSRKEDDI